MTLDGPNDWLRDKDPEFVRNFIASRIDQSVENQEQCKALEIAYFDTADGFAETLHAAKKYLRE